MDRIGTPGATAESRFQNANPLLGESGTVLGALWLNGVQEELLAVIEAAGLTPSANVVNQLLQALLLLTGGDATTPSVAAGAAHAGLVSGLPALGQRQAIVLARGSGEWTAGTAPNPPVESPKNTLLANEFASGVYPGDAWPWMTPGLAQIGIGADAGSKWPGSIAGSNVNFYRNAGFVLPERTFTNGARLEVSIVGELQTTVATRILEFAIDCEFDPAVAFDAEKSFAFQTAALPDTSGATELFELRLSLHALGYVPGSSSWAVGVTGRFFLGQSPVGNLTTSTRRAYRILVPIAKVDFGLEDTLWAIRWKTDDSGATLGDTGNTSGSDQTGAEITATVRNYQVVLFPGSF